MKATYVSSGHPGSTSDSAMFREAVSNGFSAPPNKFFLADGGFPSCDLLLVSYRGVRYGLDENSNDPTKRQVINVIFASSDLTIFSDPKMRKSCLTFAMHQLAA
jgi:hypothetical protein